VVGDPLGDPLEPVVGDPLGDPLGPVVGDPLGDPLGPVVGDPLGLAHDQRDHRSKSDSGEDTKTAESEANTDADINRDVIYKVFPEEHELVEWAIRKFRSKKVGGVTTGFIIDFICRHQDKMAKERQTKPKLISDIESDPELETESTSADPDGTTDNGTVFSI
jgi:hypothetical protein